MKTECAWSLILKTFAVAWLLSLWPVFAVAQEPLPPPQGLQVFDTPNDAGKSLTVLWAPGLADDPQTRYQVLAGEGGLSDASMLKVIAEFPADSHFVRETKAPWWTRRAEASWHQFVIKSGKNLGDQGRACLCRHSGRGPR